MKKSWAADDAGVIQVRVVLCELPRWLDGNTEWPGVFCDTLLPYEEMHDVCPQHNWRLTEWILCWVGCGLFLLYALL